MLWHREALKMERERGVSFPSPLGTCCQQLQVCACEQILSQQTPLMGQYPKPSCGYLVQSSQGDLPAQLKAKGGKIMASQEYHL